MVQYETVHGPLSSGVYSSKPHIDLYQGSKDLTMTLVAGRGSDRGLYKHRNIP